MSSAANYASSARTAGVLISTANANRDGTGTLGLVIAAGTQGTRVDSINVQALATTTAGMVRLFLYNGSSYFPLREIPVSAKTPSATDTAFSVSLVSLALLLQAGWSLYASTQNAESFAVTVTFAGDF